MLTFRCTAQVRRRLGIPQIGIVPPSTTRLGDWYVNLILTRRFRLLIFVSEPTLLSVVIPIRELTTLVPRFRSALAQLLGTLGVSSQLIQIEIDEFGSVAFASTKNRSVLGSMNDLIHQAKYELKRRPERSPFELSLNLSRIPCGPLGYRYPGDVAVTHLMGAESET